MIGKELSDKYAKFMERHSNYNMPDWYYTLEENLHAPFRAVRNFFKRVYRIIQYIPVIYKNEDWDYDYLVNLVEYKLTRIRDCIYNNSIVAPSEARDTCIQINQALDHIKQYRNATVCAPEDLPPYTFNFNEDGTITFSEDEIFEKRQEFFNKVNELEDKEWNLIWDTIKEYGRNWWD